MQVEPTKVYMVPTPTDASRDTTNAINQIVLRLAKHLPKYGFVVVEDRESADLVVGHAGQGAQGPVDVAHCHGLYPTAYPGSQSWHWSANTQVIRNLLMAREITVPSEWVGDIIRRNMRVEPHVIGWAIEPDDWWPGNNEGYVLWNKTRRDSVCDPTPMQSLARLSPGIPFKSTFGEPTGNVSIIGRLPYEVMREMVRNAGVYLATTKETFGIGTLEAMASAVPVLGYAWGGTQDIVQHGVTGYLVEPGDTKGLQAGLAYCLQHRDVLGNNARKVALEYTWDKVAQQIAEVYRKALQPRYWDGVTVVVPCHNYENYLPQALASVQRQEVDFPVDVIVVDDASDNGDLVREIADEHGATYVRTSDLPVGVANARNLGVSLSSHRHVLCLDADDTLGDASMLSLLRTAMLLNPALGVAYTGLTVMDADGNLSDKVHTWPGDFNFDRQMSGHNQVPTCCMFRKEAWERADGYEKLYQPAEDARLWTRIASLGFQIQQVTTAGMFHYRMHNRSLTASIREGDSKEPNWTYGFERFRKNDRPFVSGGTPSHSSWPVKNYDEPLVSVIIPVGPGHEQYLRDALKSMEYQTEEHWEVIVVNDTGQPLSVYPYTWARVVDTKGKVGAGAARNLGLKKAKARLVTFLDADDVFMPEFLLKTISKHRSTGMYAYTDWISINKQGVQELNECPDYSQRDVFTKPSMHSVSILLPTEWAIKVGGFDEEMPAWEDVDFFMKLAMEGFCGARVAEPLLVYRYQTGFRREGGEEIKAKLLDLLSERYNAAIINGEYKMCCGVPVKTNIVAAPNSSEQVADGQAIRVQYDGKGVPEAKTTVVGLSTRTPYGRRARGDVFMVWMSDYEAMKNFFSPVTTIVEEPRVTQTPSAPVSL